MEDSDVLVESTKQEVDGTFGDEKKSNNVSLSVEDSQKSNLTGGEKAPTVENSAQNSVENQQKYNEEVKKEQRKEESQPELGSKEWFEKDSLKFANEYPNVNTDLLLADVNFLKFADGKAGNQSMSEIYAGYTELVNNIEQAAIQKAEIEFEKRLKKAKSSPGSLSENSAPHQDIYSLEQLKNMSSDEIQKNWDAVTRSVKLLSIK